MYSKELIITADFDAIVSQKLFATQTDLKRIIHGKIAKKKKIHCNRGFHEDLLSVINMEG